MGTLKKNNGETRRDIWNMLDTILALFTSTRRRCCCLLTKHTFISVCEIWTCHWAESTRGGWRIWKWKMGGFFAGIWRDMKKVSAPLCNKKEGGGMKSLLYHITHLGWIFHVGLQDDGKTSELRSLWSRELQFNLHLLPTIREEPKKWKANGGFVRRR